MSNNKLPGYLTENAEPSQTIPPINPAARRAPAGGPPEATIMTIPESGKESDRVVPCPRVVRDILLSIQGNYPQTIFRKIYGINDKNVISFQVDNQLVFFSWYEGIPELADVENEARTDLS